MAKINEKGWWINGSAEAVHPDLIRVTDKIKDEVVMKLLHKADELSEKIAQFKAWANEQAEAYFTLLLQEYGIDEKRRAKKGNLTLTNFSDTNKVELRIHEIFTFDEKLQVAKLKIDEYLEDKVKDADPEIKTLITRAFEVDKEGKIDAKKIFALKSYDIKDPRWLEAMSIIDESKKIRNTKPYIRFYMRNTIDEPYKLVPLDIAGV
ncbi:MAG: DUF3164 family protein [Campylobacteraceae bacterium]|nr:DUF3164 family protein [Campylobacteraceae bacterium]